MSPRSPHTEADDFYRALGRFNAKREKLANAGSSLDADDDGEMLDVLQEWNEWELIHEGTTEKKGRA